MGKIKVKQASDGSWQASAIVVSKGAMRRVGAKMTTGENIDEGSKNQWRQLVLDLFSQRDLLQDGASKEETV